MKETYSFLKDDLAILEIRRHKHLESQRLGQEVGFATAAVDWIQQYGETFKQTRLSLKNAQDSWAEKRQHRRFQKKLPLLLSIGERIFKSCTEDINLVGLSCTVPEFIAHDTVANVSLRFQPKGRIMPGPLFTFKSKVSRVTDKTRTRRFKSAYRIFLPFSEEVRDYLRKQSKILA